MYGTVEDVVNAALRRLGNSTPIGWIYEGSKASRAALEIYGQTRDSMLQVKDWPFARRDAAAAPVAAQPPPQWALVYAWPADCLRLRQVIPQARAALDPRPMLFTDANATVGGVSSKVIYANVAAADLVYTARITNPAQWDAAFTETMVEALTRRLTIAVTNSAQLIEPEAEIEAGAENAALMAQANAPPLPVAREMAQQAARARK